MTITIRRAGSTDTGTVLSEVAPVHVRRVQKNTSTNQDTSVSQGSISEDVELITWIIEDNENWNKLGIPDKDIQVCFEMSYNCDWGMTYTTARFNAAMKALDERRVYKSGERWFPASSDGRELRTCEGPRCDTDISHKRAGAKYCSTKCQVAATRKRQAADCIG